MQDDAGYLGPVRTVPLGVEQTQIGHEMRLVINGDVVDDVFDFYVAFDVLEFLQRGDAGLWHPLSAKPT